MKKFVKLSLVAAVAVSGLTAANAASLEESIKNIDVSGAARLRYQTEDKTAANNYTKQGYTVDIANKVADDATVTVSFTAKDVNSARNTTISDPNVQFSGFNVTYTGVQDTTLIIGKQALGTPFSVASDLTGTDHTGTGVIAVNSSTPVTLIGAFMEETNITAPVTVTNIALAAAKGSIAGLGLEAWYAKSLTSGGDLKTGFYKASYALTLDQVKLNAAVQHATGKLAAAAKNAITRYELSAAMGMFDGGIKYATVNKNGQTVAFDATAAAKNGGMEGIVVNASNTKADGDAAMYYVNAKVLPSLKVGAYYLNVESTNTSDDEETVGYAAWTVGKGTTLTTYIGSSDVNNVSGNVTRIQLDYKF